MIQIGRYKLGVAKTNYSLWGGSAGARMAATLGNKNNLLYLTDDPDIPQAAAVVMQYTGYSTTSPQDPPTYNGGFVEGVYRQYIDKGGFWRAVVGVIGYFAAIFGNRQF